MIFLYCLKCLGSDRYRTCYNERIWIHLEQEQNPEAIAWPPRPSRQDAGWSPDAGDLCVSFTDRLELRQQSSSMRSESQDYLLQTRALPRSLVRNTRHRTLPMLNGAFSPPWFCALHLHTFSRRTFDPFRPLVLTRASFLTDP